jgi:hypothetical protein
MQPLYHSSTVVVHWVFGYGIIRMICNTVYLVLISIFKNFMASGKVGKKKAKGQVYDFIILILSEIILYM